MNHLSTCRLGLAIKILLLITVIFCAPIIFTSGIVGNLGDISQYVAPFRNFSKTTLQTGVVPLWNPHIFSGTPFLASPQSALFYPLTSIFHFMTLRIAVNFFCVLHIFLNALGMFLLLLSLKRSLGTAITASVFWTFSSFFLFKISAGYIVQLSAYAWAPWIFLFAIRSLSSHLGHESKPTLQNFTFIGLLLSSALQFFSGHLQVWLHTMIFVFFLFLWKTAANYRQKGEFNARLLACFVLCLTSITLVQLLPTFVYSLYSAFYMTEEIFKDGLIYGSVTSYSMKWSAFLGLLIPDFFGNPLKGTFLEPNKPLVYFETFAIYFGIIPLFFALGGVWALVKKKCFFLPAVILIFTLFATSENSFAYNVLTKYFAFLEIPARYFFLVFTGLVLVSSSFFDKTIKKWRPIYKMLLFVVIVGDLYYNCNQFLWSEKYDNKQYKGDAIEWLQSRKKMDGLPYRIFTTPDIKNPNKVMMSGLENANGYETILQKSLLFYFTWTQKDPLINMTMVNVKDPSKASFSLLSVRYLISSRQLKTDWPIKYMAGNLKIFENPHPLPPARAVFVLKNKSAKHFHEFYWKWESDQFNYKEEIIKIGKEGIQTLPQTEVYLTRFTRPNTNRIDTDWKSKGDNPFWIFLSESFYPGWEVWTESGKNLSPFLANGYFQAVLYPGSKMLEGKVFWCYRPREFTLGVLSSIFSVIAFIILGFLKLRLVLEQRP